MWYWLWTQETDKTLGHYGLYRVKPRSCITPISRLEARGMVLHVINEKTLLKERRYLPFRSSKCYSEISQCKHAWGCSVSTDGASQQRQHGCVDMPELAANSAEPTKPTQEAGHIRLPYNMNCHSYTRNGKRRTYLKCKHQNTWSFRADRII